MNQDWSIKARGPNCAACARPFADRQPCHTRLTYDAQGYARADFCEPCWQGVAAQPRYSAWRSVFRVPPPEPERRVRKETAESLLRELLGRDALRHRNAVYLLAVMLERQRVFIERDVQTSADGTRMILYEHRRTGETFAIADPQLGLADLEPVQRELMALLGADGRQGAHA